jgi:hypothetical protein
MTEEVQISAEVPAPELEATAAPETEVIQPEEKPAEASKTFTQEELDAAIGKRLAREQRKWEREQAQRAVQPQAPQTLADLPPADQFESVDAYAEALATRKAEEMLRDRDAKRRQQEVLSAYHDREEEVRAKYDDFEQVAYNPSLPITNVMAEAIQSSDIGPEVAYFLGTNPKEAERISKLTPYVQAKEIGKIEAKLADNPPVKKTSSAPTPITPVTARTTGSPAYDTTDPRSTKTMTASQWIEAENKRERKRLEAQRN